ncbi:MAG: hypothetical protein HOP08_09250 [Cyclobacteriaceae bacterium]|nr:hypothetical protein [Cyclobacteriaceae bacterium]
MKKKDKKKEVKKTKEAKKVLPDEDAKESKQFDFGGLPARDLKKNLGCG